MECFEHRTCEDAGRGFDRLGRRGLGAGRDGGHNPEELVHLVVEQCIHRHSPPRTLGSVRIPHQAKGDGVPSLDHVEALQGRIDLLRCHDLVRNLAHHIPLHPVPLFDEALMQAAKELYSIAFDGIHREKGIECTFSTTVFLPPFPPFVTPPITTKPHRRPVGLPCS